MKTIQIIKIFVIALFLLPAFLFYGGFLETSKVTGQTGGSSLAAPTGVTATDGAYSTKVGLLWDTMRGATVYRIFRNIANDPATATAVGSTAANYFFDTSAVQNQQYFYWVRAENGSLQSDLSTADQGRRASGNLSGQAVPLDPPDAPPGNPVTAAKASLGKALFWDEQLSSTRTVSCGTCHSGSSGGIDKRTGTQRTRSTNPGFDGIFNNADDVFGSPGVIANNPDGTYNWSNRFGFNEQVTTRRTLPYTDAGYSTLLFWDGRATPIFRDPLTNQIILPAGAALESQVLAPPVNDTEMGHPGRNWQQVADRISNVKPLALASDIPSGLKNWIDGRTYAELFQETFGTPEVTPARIAMAIATHERTLFSDQTPFDQFHQGIGTLTAPEQRGMNLFNSGVSSCSACHAGNRQSDDAFHNIGVRPQIEDTGRQQVSNNQANAGQFRTPTLRNVELRGAYFHNGRFTTLREVVDFYNRGGDFNSPNKDPNVRPRNFSNGQITDLVAFLSRPLTDPRVRSELPPFDRPTLYSESNRVPQITGTGVAGSNGIIPQAIAIEPPLAGNPAFTVAISNALGSAQAVLVINSTDPGTSSIPASGSFAHQTITLQGNGSGNGNGSIALAIPNNPSLVGQTFFGRWYVTDASAPNGFSVTPAFRFTIFGESTSGNRPAFVDFDGDKKTDVSIFRPSNGSWWYQKSADNQVAALQFGTGTDKLVPADFTGDGKTDVAVFRQSTGEWFVLRSENNSFYGFPFGSSGDIPVAADFDGDGKADPTVFRPSNAGWYSILSSNGSVSSRTFGVNGDVPQVGDYDADGKADLAIFRPSSGQWWINRSSSGLLAVTFGGESNDKPAAADFTGDGKADIAFFRASTGFWYILRSEDLSFYGFQFGIANDVPAPGDYDGDGKTDVAIFRSGVWYINRSTSGLLALTFGSVGDYPVPAAYVP